MALFEITKRSRRVNYALQTPNPGSAAGTIDFARGIAFQESAVAGVSELADGSNASIGFITRDCISGGPQLGDVIYPGKIQLPETSGGQASFEDAEEVEVEGAGYIDAAHPITAATPLKTLLSFAGGKWCVAQAAQIAEFQLQAILTPEVAGNVRFKARRVHGPVKA